MRHTPIAGTAAVRKVLRILEDLGIAWPLPAERTVIERIVAGHWQRSAGSWVWTLTSIDRSEHVPSIGSCDSIRSLRRGYVSSHVSPTQTGDTHLNAENSPQE